MTRDGHSGPGSVTVPLAGLPPAAAPARTGGARLSRPRPGTSHADIKLSVDGAGPYVRSSPGSPGPQEAPSQPQWRASGSSGPAGARPSHHWSEPKGKLGAMQCEFPPAE
jgi:hypothetical protein